MPLANLREAGEAVGPGHPQVEQDEVGIRAADHRQDLRAGRALADDLEVVGTVEGPLDPLEDQLVVVGNENAHGRMVVGVSA